LLTNINAFLQILNTLGRWFYLLVKHYRITLGIILFFNLISSKTYSGNHIPWFTLTIILYFIFHYSRKLKQKQLFKNEIHGATVPIIHIDNKNYIRIGKTSKFSSEKIITTNQQPEKTEP
jgi:hypothetical protein